MPGDPRRMSVAHRVTEEQMTSSRSHASESYLLQRPCREPAARSCHSDLLFTYQCGGSGLWDSGGEQLAPATPYKLTHVPGRLLPTTPLLCRPLSRED